MEVEFTPCLYRGFHGASFRGHSPRNRVLGSVVVSGRLGMSSQAFRAFWARFGIARPAGGPNGPGGLVHPES